MVGWTNTVNAFEVKETNRPMVYLKSQSHVSGEYILLKDIFENVEKYQDRKITKAPEPGHEVTFGVRYLSRIARTFRLNWQPSSYKQTLTIKRESNPLSDRKITELIREQLKPYTDLLQGDVHFNERIQTIHLPVDEKEAFQVKLLKYDNTSHRFRIELASLPNSSFQFKKTYTGKIIPYVSVPVLLRAKAKNDIIQDSDIGFMRVASHKLSQNTVIDKKYIIGKAPRRMLKNGHIFNKTDLTFPVLVKKGEMVSVDYKSDFMRLTVQAKSLQNGKKNDVIRLMNPQSKRVFEAKITDINKAEVFVRHD